MYYITNLVICQAFITNLVYNFFTVLVYILFEVKFMVIAQRLKESRVQAGMKLKDVAEKLNITIQTVLRYENGSREPSLETLVTFCRLYDVSADYLLGLTNSL